jgi:signal transduction histidine kinase
MSNTLPSVERRGRAVSGAVFPTLTGHAASQGPSHSVGPAPLTEPDQPAARLCGAESQAAQRRILEAATARLHRLARDLHDGAQQRLVNLLLVLQLAGEHLPAGSAGKQLVDNAVEEATAAIEELRALASGMHPAILVHRGLIAAVQAMARRNLVPVVVVSTLTGRLPRAVEANAYFIIAEALTNATKHARASSVAVTIRCDVDALWFSIEDDGIGGATDATGGAGMTGMTDRANALGGRLVIDSADGAGTRIRAVMPIVPRSDRPSTPAVPSPAAPPVPSPDR